MILVCIRFHFALSCLRLRRILLIPNTPAHQYQITQNNFHLATNMFGAHSLGVLAAAGFGHFANVFEHVKSSTSVLYARCNTWDASQALVCVFEAEVDSSKIRPGPSAWKFASQNEYEREGGDQGESEGENDGDGDGDRDVQGSFRNNNTSVTKEDEPFGSKVEDDSPGFGAEDDSLYSEEEHLERVAEKLKRWILEHPKEAAELLACLTSAPAAVILTPIVLGLIGFTPLGVAAGKSSRYCYSSKLIFHNRLP